MIENAFRLGDVELLCGETMADAVLAYATYGSLNQNGDNCILIPTYYTGRHQDYAAVIGPGRALDPERFFIVIANMFGNGLSTSPSHLAAGEARAAFPLIAVADNVACQSRLLFEHFGVRKIRLITGWSMGAMQALWWGALHPHAIEGILAVCGTASCWPLNQVFLEGVTAALRADSVFKNGLSDQTPELGLRAFGRAYAGWAYSATFFRQQLYRNLGCASQEALLTVWEESHLKWNASDLLSMAATWRTADIGAIVPDGDYRAALGRISAKTIIMPCDTDAYFTVEESRLEAHAIANAELRIMHSPFGHCAGAPGRFPGESAKVEAAMRELLQ